MENMTPVDKMFLLRQVNLDAEDFHAVVDIATVTDAYTNDPEGPAVTGPSDYADEPDNFVTRDVAWIKDMLKYGWFDLEGNTIKLEDLAIDAVPSRH